MLTEHIPYTYLIGWSSHNKWYYGVRFRDGCHPTDLWTTYFTSSKYVTEARELYGEPDIIEVRATFANDPQKARLYENKVLVRLKVISSDKWLNKTNNIAIASMKFWDEDVVIARNKKVSDGTKKTMNDPTWKATVGAERTQKIISHHKEHMDRPIIHEINNILKTYNIKLYQGWPNHDDNKLETILKDLQDKTKTMQPYVHIYSEKSSKRNASMQIKMQRPIVQQIKELQLVLGCKLGTGWWQKSDEELEELLKTLTV